jgi:hypothetical protein
MAEAAPIRIKFIGRAASERVPEVWLRQLPGGNPLYRGCHFLFDIDATDYDWLVVYDDLPAQAGERFSSRRIELNCPSAHTMLITMEPSSIKLYGSAFLNQFAYILSSQEPSVIRHKGHLYQQAGLRWYYGLSPKKLLTYDEMAAHPPLDKTKIISTICSDKRQRHTLHNLRSDFTDAMIKLIPEIEVFGHGVRDMNDKAEALRDFRYHIAIENHQGLHHWTEKLSDCFLACCLPFYFGAPNAGDYFPIESFIPIDIRDVKTSADMIRAAIAGNEWSKRKEALLEARRLAMEDYSLFAQIAREVTRLNALACAPEGGTILSRRAARKAHPFASLPDITHMVLRKTKALFKPVK